MKDRTVHLYHSSGLGVRWRRGLAGGCRKASTSSGTRSWKSSRMRVMGTKYQDAAASLALQSCAVSAPYQALQHGRPNKRAWLGPDCHHASGESQVHDPSRRAARVQQRHASLFRNSRTNTRLGCKTNGSPEFQFRLSADELCCAKQQGIFAASRRPLL